MLDFSRFSILTFDCYGTLIDWETGISPHFAPSLRRMENRFPALKSWSCTPTSKLKLKQGSFIGTEKSYKP
jgi:FMN phosphatase YigB (HAD superfamily)